MEIMQSVTYVDPRGNERPALVTNVFRQTTKQLGGPKPSINVVFVNDDDKQSDSYGRKIERATSVPHQEQQFAHGNYWK
jgi:hypothetical protein